MLSRIIAAVVDRTERVLAIPAVASAIWTFFSYDMMIEPLGWGLKGRFVALVGAIAAGTLYWAGAAMLIALVPKFSVRGLLLVLPGILAYMLLVIASSSYPQVMLFHAPARDAETATYVTKASGYSDAIKLGVASAKGLGPVVDGDGGLIEGLANLERKGAISGIESAGMVVATLEALAADVRQTGTSIVKGATAADRLVDEIDATLSQMRAAAKDRSLDFEARRSAFEGHSDRLRTTGIALSQAIPLTALSALAKRLQSKLIKPASNAKAGVRQKQADALVKIEGELEKIGADLEARIAAAMAGLAQRPPIYEPEPVSMLILTYWRVLVTAWSVSLSIDLFVIVFLYLACVAEFEARRQARITDERPAWVVEAQAAIEAVKDLEMMSKDGRSSADDLGEHPYPGAMRGRADDRRRAQSKRRNGSGNGSAGTDR